VPEPQQCNKVGLPAGRSSNPYRTDERGKVRYVRRALRSLQSAALDTRDVCRPIERLRRRKHY
ncbi:hypothetical protein NPIL_607501, partial [Nephila pilipes]